MITSLLALLMFRLKCFPAEYHKRLLNLETFEVLHWFMGRGLQFTTLIAMSIPAIATLLTLDEPNSRNPALNFHFYQDDNKLKQTSDVRCFQSRG